MSMYVREPVPAVVVAARVVRAFIRQGRGRNLRLDVRIVLGERSGRELLAVEYEGVKQLSER
jgi:hypothetical protein